MVVFDFPTLLAITVFTSALVGAFCCSHGSSTEGSLRSPYGDRLLSLPLSPRY